MSTAMSELPTLLGQLSTNLSIEDCKLQYVAALLAEFAYCDFPKREKTSVRVKGLLEKLSSVNKLGRGRSYAEYVLRSIELPGAFVLRTDYFMSIGVPVGDRLFLAFRGTKIFRGQDWKINFTFKKVEVYPRFRIKHIWSSWTPDKILVPRGFLNETLRIVRLIKREIRSMGIKTVVLTGHSLGGAVASLAHFLFLSYETRLFTFGAPRTYLFVPRGRLESDVRKHFVRWGDTVAEMAPEVAGYYDIERQFKPNSNRPLRSTLLYRLLGPVKWGLFILSGTRPHSIKQYRKQVGSRAKVKFYSKDLVKEPEIPGLARKFAF